MTKKDLALVLQSCTNLSSNDSYRVIVTLVKAMSKTLAEGENIYFREFGTFKIVTRKPKAGRIITKAEAITIPERKAVKFIPSRSLKDSVK